MTPGEGSAATSLGFRDGRHPEALHTGTCHHSDHQFRKHPDVPARFRLRETGQGGSSPCQLLGEHGEGRG